MTKVCFKCKVSKDISEFYPSLAKYRKGILPYCKLCQVQTGLSQIKKLRDQCFEILGKQCVVCGFNDMRALQIDHIKGCGSKVRKVEGNYKTYKDVLENPERYQILCANCNWIKRAENNKMKRR